MRTYAGSNSHSIIEPVLWNAKKSVWIISPWLGSNYAKRLALLSQKGIEVRIVTSNVDYNSDSLEILQASANPNLMPLVLDQDKAAFIHSKIYLIDNKHAISGSANLTFSGLYKNVESLSITETEDEIRQIETDFMRIWMKFERKRMSKEELSNGTSHSIKNALPLSVNYGEINYSNIKDKELIYHPYYFFEFSFRTSVGKSPPILFENHGLVILDGVSRQIIRDNLLIKEINGHSGEDYFLRTENKYRLTFDEPKIRDFREARELVLDYIIEKNTRHYTQNYGSRSYDRIFVPYRNIIRFIKSGFIQVPTWHIERHESDGRRHEDLVFGSSGKKWNELVYCPDCQKKIWIDKAVKCNLCGRLFCSDCIKTTGLIFKKKNCNSCLVKKQSYEVPVNHTRRIRY